MTEKSANSEVAVSLERERFIIMSLADGNITTMGTHELVHPFGLINFQEDARDLEVHRDALENLIQKNGASGREASVIIGEDMVQVKRIPVALGFDDSALDAQMKWEAGQLLLSPQSAFHMVYQRLPAKTSSGNPYYLLVLIRKSILKALRTLIESAGCSFHELEIDIFSHLRALQMNYTFNREDIVALLSVQGSGLLFTFILQEDYYLSHRIHFPKMESLGSSDLVDLVKKELRRLIFGHRLGQDLGDLKKLFVLGNALTDALIQNLEKALPIPIEKLNPLKKVALPPELAQSKEILQFPERFAATIGMLLKNHPQLIQK
ncbi:hypothetical protein JW835_09995 [bacterium]|nr:hypothetical protein [bacterium]